MANECSYFLEFKGPNVPKDSSSLSRRLGIHPEDGELAVDEKSSLYLGYSKWNPPVNRIRAILNDSKFDITSCTVYWEEMSLAGAGVIKYIEGKEVSRDYLDCLAPASVVEDFKKKHPQMEALLLDAN